MNARLPAGLLDALARLAPGARVERARALSDDAAPEGETEKGLGYGRNLRVDLRLPDGRLRALVIHTPRADDFGHDRRADRVAGVVSALDTFAQQPRHVPALDAGLVARDGTLVSFAGTDEPYLITEWADGTLYADDLRALSRSGRASDADLGRIDALARHLADVHAAPGSHPEAYVRALRDLVGSGEGIAGIADGYETDVPGAPRTRIETIERACLDWRLRLRDRKDRLRRTHGDFHPFNILFSPEGEVVALDASRGGEGDPADDVAALTINLLFFGIEHRDRWAGGLGALWSRFFERYAAARRDEALFDVLAPFFAWRGLVLASPRWYPALGEADRDRILSFVERALAAPRFDPAFGPEAMR